MKTVYLITIMVLTTVSIMGILHHHVSASDPEGTEIEDDTIKIPESATFPNQEQSSDAEPNIIDPSICKLWSGCG